MIVISNGIECFCLPDCAVCQACHKRMNDIQECPEHNDTCEADCEYYTELWDENELKAELAKDEDENVLKENSKEAEE